MVVGENGAAGIPAQHLVKVELKKEHVFATTPSQNTKENTAMLMVLQILKPNHVAPIHALVKISVVMYNKSKTVLYIFNLQNRSHFKLSILYTFR